MPQVQLKRYEQIIADIVGRVCGGSALSDLADTSEFKSIIAGVSREIDEAYYQLTRLRAVFDLNSASGADLDSRAAEIQPGTITRTLARKAIGTVQFSRTGTTGTVTIPAGTVVKTSSGVSFITTIQTQILDGQTTSGLISIIAVEVGTAGNVAAGTIVAFGSKIAGVDAVTNTTGTTQGRDIETDNVFRRRLFSYIATLSQCTANSVEGLVLGAQDPTSGKVVQFAKVINDIANPGKSILYIDDGAGTAQELGTAISNEVVIGAALGGEEVLYLDSFPVDDVGSTLSIMSDSRGTLTRDTDYFLDPTNGQLKFVPSLNVSERITANYTPFVNLIAHVQKIVNGDTNDAENFPGYKAGGVRMQVLSPSIVTVAVEAVLTIDDSIEGTALTTVTTNVRNAILDYINTVGISGDIIQNRLIDRIMGITGVTDVNLITPTSNVVVLDDQLPRNTTSDLNIQ